MAIPFPADARVVQLSGGPPRSDRRLGLLWPAWAYRVTAPVLQMRGIDLFERVVLGLCQAGVRSPDRIAELVHLDPRLCAHLLEQAAKAGHLDEHRDLTEQGRSALRTGAVTETPEWAVLYVFQDPFTKELWPRTVERLIDGYVLTARQDEILLQLGTAGRDDKVWARRIMPADPAPQQLGPAKVLAAVSADRADRRVDRVREFERRQGLDGVAVPADVIGSRGPGLLGGDLPELHRISAIGTEPEPVFLVGFVEVTAARSGMARAEGWVAHDPFGVGHSETFRSLIHRYAPEDSQVDQAIAERVESEVARVGQRHRETERELRTALEARMVHELGPAIRDHRDAHGLMMDVELAMERGDQDDAIEKVVLATLRLYEELLRRMAAEYPVPDELMARSSASRQVSRAGLEAAAQKLGFHALPAFYVRSISAIQEAQRKPGESFVKELVALCLLAAGSTTHPDHPLRRMAARRPDLLNSLKIINNLRNRGTHGGRDATSVHDARWCRDLASEAARELLLLPDPILERTAR
jgi:hypothetical protein